MIQQFYIKDIKESFESPDDLYNIIKKRVLYCKNFQILKPANKLETNLNLIGNNTGGNNRNLTPPKKK